ncbi:MAG: hypothetical protein OFPI_42040 [Osedax symbiont Rs2]|nr:MAG: hypothetical protein OFPI_42040 [Osedax symbiont Rs2]
MTLRSYGLKQQPENIFNSQNAVFMNISIAMKTTTHSNQIMEYCG